jgi:hypothetical protein
MRQASIPCRLGVCLPRRGAVSASHAACIAVVLGGTVVPALAACNKTITVTETQQMNYCTIAVTSGGGTVTNYSGTYTVTVIY